MLRVLFKIHTNIIIQFIIIIIIILKYYWADIASLMYVVRYLSLHAHVSSTTIPTVHYRRKSLGFYATRITKLLTGQILSQLLCRLAGDLASF
jgi:hypothetical protein